MAAMTRTSTLIADVAANAVELVFLQDAEQLRLGLGGQLADLVEEDRPPIGELEPADPPGDGAGEGPLLMTEEFAFHEPGGQCRAVELDQRLVAASAVRVDRPARSVPCPCPSRR